MHVLDDLAIGFRHGLERVLNRHERRARIIVVLRELGRQLRQIFLQALHLDLIAAVPRR